MGSLKDIFIPKLDADLSELIGIHLGDGTITKNFIRIFGDTRYDMHYFYYISKLIKNLFGVSPSLTVDKRSGIQKHSLILWVSSRKICDFLNVEYGIPYGNKIKNGAKIPSEILGDSELLKACLRGLVDTDGSVCRRDNYLCLAFNSHNQILMKQIWDANKSLDIFSHKSNFEIGTNSWNRIIKFFNEVGSSNMSHIIRFCERYDNNNFLYKEEVLKYLNLYKDIKLPFKLGP